MVGFYDLCIHGGIHGLPAHTQQDASRLGRGKLDAVVLLADGRLLGCHRGSFPHGSSSMALADRQAFWQNVEAVYYDLSRFGCRQFRRHIRRNVCPNLLLPYGIFHSLRLGCYSRFGSRLTLAPHHRALCTRHRRCHRPLHGGESAFRLSHSQIHVAGKG